MGFGQQYDAQQRLIGMTNAEPQGERSQRWRLDALGNRLPLPSSAVRTFDNFDNFDKPDWSTQVRQNLNNPDFNLLKPEQGGPGANAEVQRWKTNRMEYSTQTDKNGQTRTVHYLYDAHGNRHNVLRARLVCAAVAAPAEQGQEVSGADLLGHGANGWQ